MTRTTGISDKVKILDSGSSEVSFGFIQSASSGDTKNIRQLFIWKRDFYRHPPGTHHTDEHGWQ